MLLEAETGVGISTITTLGTSLVTWFVSTWSTIITFMLNNPICFVGLVVWLIVAAIGIVRRVIGG